MISMKRKYRDSYGYPPNARRGSRTTRPEYPYIVEWVAWGSRVLDLGCGDGSLGGQLISKKRCKVWGIDVDRRAVLQSRAKGVRARVGDMDAGLPFSENEFDCCVLNATLQMVYRPGFVLSESLRVGRSAIVSFPNFAHLPSRLEMLLFGRVPRTALFGYSWHDTRHIHHLSYNDFLSYCSQNGVEIVRRQALFLKGSRPNPLSDLFPSLFCNLAIFEIRRK